MFLEVGGGIDHAEDLDDPGHSIQAAELGLQGGKHGEPHLSGGEFALLFVDVCADTSGKQGAIRGDRTMTGDEGQVSGDDQWFINSGRGRCGREIQSQFGYF